MIAALDIFRVAHSLAADQGAEEAGKYAAGRAGYFEGEGSRGGVWHSALAHLISLQLNDEKNAFPKRAVP